MHLPGVTTTTNSPQRNQARLLGNQQSSMGEMPDGDVATEPVIGDRDCSVDPSLPKFRCIGLKILEAGSGTYAHFKDIRVWAWET